MADTVSGGFGFWDVTTGGPLTTKGDVFIHDGTAAARLPVGPNGQVLTADSAVANGVKWAPPSSAGGGGLLAIAQHWPAAAASYALTSTLALINAATSVTFTVPGSGKVLVRLSGVAYAASASNHVRVGVLDGGAVVNNTAFVMQTGNAQAFSCAFLISGLTGGASKTYGFGAKSATGGGEVLFGGADGPAVIEVWEAP